MNQDVRKFLIDQCVKGQPIYYEAVGKMLALDLNLESDRHILSKELGAISAFEYENERPLISCIAIYKQKNDHGYGFYHLCEELGIGKSSNLTQQLYGFAEIEKCKNYWNKSEHYAAYYDLIEKVEINHKLDFFTIEEINFLATWANEVYDKDNSEHVAAKNYIMNSLGTKTQYWSNQIINLMPEMGTFNWRMWSQKGWGDTTEGKIRVARFKPYTWARIYRKGDGKKDIFFTVGVDGNTKELIFKLDYYFEKNSNLNSEQKKIVEKNIPKDVRWRSISANEIADYDWKSLIELTSSFISDYLHIYDKLIQLAWGKSEPETVLTNFLRPTNFPDGAITSLPILNPTFEGVTKDFIQEAIDKKEIGNAGEELVKQHEISRLRNIGFADLAEQVEIVIDGRGYDVLSFDNDRKPKYIEVKTTVGSSLTPFYFSINEKIFAEQNIESYIIYRLYNFDDENNTADFFTVKNIKESLLMQPVEFKVYLKKQI